MLFLFQNDGVRNPLCLDSERRRKCRQDVKQFANGQGDINNCQMPGPRDSSCIKRPGFARAKCLRLELTRTLYYLLNGRSPNSQNSLLQKTTSLMQISLHSSSHRVQNGVARSHFCLIKGRIIFYEERESVDFHFGLQDFFDPPPLLDPLKIRDSPPPSTLGTSPFWIP